MTRKDVAGLIDKPYSLRMEDVLKRLDMVERMLADLTAKRVVAPKPKESEILSQLDSGTTRSELSAWVAHRFSMSVSGARQLLARMEARGLLSVDYGTGKAVLRRCSM